MPPEGECAELVAARALVPRIAGRALEIEEGRRVPDDLARAMFEADLVQMAVPEVYGGRESHPVDILRVIEEISYADGSAGWCLMNWQTTALASGLIPKRFGEEIFAKRGGAVPAGVLALTGRARRVDGGIVANGRWGFASGCPNADWLLGTVVMEGNGGESGTPEVLYPLFSRDQFEIEDTWHVSGLCGSGSHHVAVEEAFVPEGRWAAIGASPAVDTPLYRLPIVGFFPPCVVAVSLGIARAALDGFESLARDKVPARGKARLAERPTVQVEFARAEAQIDAGRSYVFETTQAMWEEVLRGDDVATDTRRRARLASAHAAEMAAQAVHRLYIAAGSTSIALDQPLQRHWRDIHATTQHMQIAHGNFETMGRLRLTGELEGPF